MNKKLDLSIDKFANFVINRRKYIIIFSFALVAFFSIFLKDIGIEGSTRVWFGEHSHILKSYDDFRKQFGSDEGIAISFKREEGIFTKKDLLVIDTLTKALQKMPYFVKVFSLTNFPYIHIDKEYPDEILIDDFIQNIDELSEKDLNRLKEIAVHDESLVNALISKDAKTTIIGAGLISKKSITAEESLAIVNAVKAMVKPYEEQGYKFYMTGNPFIGTAFVEIALHDTLLFTPLVILSVFGLLMLMLRSFKGALLPMIVVVLTFIVVLSVQTLLGYKLNSFTANMPVFVLVIGVVHAVHIYWVWVSYGIDGHDSKEAARFSIRKNFLEVFLTALTTAIGFLSLGISEVIPIKTLGYATASAAMVAFVFSIMLVPALLSYMKQTSHLHKGKLLIDPKKYARFIVKNDKVIVFASLILLVFLIVGWTKIEINNNAIDYFKKEHKIRQAFDFVSTNISAPMPVEIVIDSLKADGIKEPDFLKKVDIFQKAYIDQFYEVKSATSLIGVVKQSNMMLNGDKKELYMIPDNKEAIAQYLLLYSFSMPITDRVDSNYRYFRVTANTMNTTTTRQIEMVEWAKKWWKNAGYPIEVEGQTAMFAYMQYDITKTLIYSLAMAVTLISLVMFIILRDIKLLIFFLIPNIFPIIAAIGVMGWLSIYVDMGAAISAAIVLGIAVDDAIHFLLKYLRYIELGHSVESALEHVMKYTGGPIVLTTLILGLSFLELTGSDFVPNIYFAITTVTAIVVALIADLLVLPAIFSIRDKKRILKEVKVS